MDDVDIICAAKDSVCKEILENFLTPFQKQCLAKSVQEKNEGEIVLSKSSVFIFFNSPEIVGDINTTLDIVIPNEYFIMIIIVTHGPKDEIRCIPSFTFPSTVRMWCSIWGDEDKSCPNTEENSSAIAMLECFLRIIKMRNIQCGEDLPCTDHAESRVDQNTQPMETDTGLTNESFDGVNNAVLVACSEISAKYFKSFSNFMKTKTGVFPQLHENSKRTPDLALCVKHDDTLEEIEKLYRVTGRSVILFMIIACDVGVRLPPLDPSIDEDVIRLRYSETSETIYDCDENRKAGEKLKTKFTNKSSFFRKKETKTIQGKEHPKTEKSQDSSKRPKKETDLPGTVYSQGEQMKTSEHLFPFNCDDLVILCNRKVAVCKPILMKFKTLYSIPIEFQWLSNAKDGRNVRKRVLVCLKISRLADDIIDAIQMVGLSDSETFFLTIIHTVEPGVEVDTSLSSQDPRIVDVAHVVYSENCGCYECPENNIAKDKFRSWIRS